MKKQLLLLTMMLLPMVASINVNAHDFEAVNAEGKTIYYVYNNGSNGTTVSVSYRGSSSSSYSNRYSGDIVIPKSVTYNGKTYSVTSIGSSAFYNCSGLTSVTIPNSVTSIGDQAFMNCRGLTSVTIPNSVTSIGSSAFMECSGLTSVTIPNSVTILGSWAFSGCSCLEYVKVPVTDYSAFCNNAIIGLIGNNISKTVTLIDENGNEIKEYVIPNDVTSIGDKAFNNCSGLTSVTIPNSVTSIGFGAFSGCSGLTSIIIPNSVTSIGDYAFSGCSGLTSLTIGSGVTSIGYSILKNTNLKKTIWLTNTPPSGYTNASGAVNYVSNNNFSSLSNVKVYQFLSSLFEVDGIKYVPVVPSERTCDAIDCVYNETAADTKILSTVTYKGINLTVKNIQPYIAYNNNFIENLTLDNEGAIADYGFYNCSNMKTASIGEKVTSIGQYAFQNCSSLEAIIIPDAVATMGQYAFNGCSKLLSASIGNGLLSLAQHTFGNCTSLNDVTIGASVKEIQTHAFSGCNSLPSITISRAVTKINDYVFSGCSGLKNIIIEDRESELTLGSNGSNPIFSDCPLDSVYIGGDISYSTSSSYGYSPFYRNTSLRAVNITDKETEISANEFYGCTNLQRVFIGDGVTTIGNYAFSGCQSLKHFAFGSQVQSIGQEAFSDCTSVIEISSKAAMPPTCGNQALDDINKWECQLFVPTGTLAAYQAADQWKDFFFAQEGTGTNNGDDPVAPEDNKCATPTISYADGKLSFSCATNGVSYKYEIAVADNKRGDGKEVDLTQTYRVSVYAVKAGYQNSDVATMDIKLGAGSGGGLKGDVNNDGVVDIADAVNVVNIIMKGETAAPAMDMP